MQAGYSPQKIINIFLETLSDISKGILKQGSINDLVAPFFALQNSKTINNEIEKNIIFNNTLKKYESLDLFDNLILKNNLFMLCNYDKTIAENGKKYFILLSMLLESINEHSKALKKYRHNKKYGSQIEKGISASHSTSNEKIISKRQNSLKESIELNEHDKVAKKSLKIMDDFIKEPYQVNLAINQTCMLFSKENLPSITEEEYQTLSSTGTYLDSDKYISSENVFYESLAATISHFYNSKSYWQQPLKLELITNQELSEIITVIIQHTFDCNYTINAKKLNSYIQLRCMYGQQLAIYEFQTKANAKVHPMFIENEENNLLYEELYTALQGKFPQKDTSISS